MDLAQTFISITVGVIVVTTLISGPLVAGVDLTSDEGDGVLFQSGIGDRANVEVVAEPAGPVFLRNITSAGGGYRLVVPPVAVRVFNVRGSPRISYHVRILGLDYIHLTTYFLNASSEGERRVLRVTEVTLDRSKVSEREYRGDLTVSVHATNGTNVIYRNNVTVKVEE